MDKRIVFLISFALIVAHVGLKAQSNSKKDLIYEITNKVVSIRKDTPVVILDAKLVNNSRFNFILYGFTQPRLTMSDSSYAVDNALKKGASNSLFIRDSVGLKATIWTQIETHSDSTVGTKGSLSRAFNELAKEYVEAIVFSRKKSSISIKLIIDLSSAAPLLVGDYQLFMIFRSGEITYKVLGTEQIDRDKKKYNASVFSGFLVSNRFKLRVE